MRIIDPVLAPDVSSWCDHINAKEFEAGGCGSIVVGLYPVFDSFGNKVLSPVSRAQCLEVVNNSSMVLQAYYWDDITYDPIKQADWVVDTIQKEGLPIKWIWADQEQWWMDWKAWTDARFNRIPWSQVPVGVPANISSHFETFMRQLYSRFPQSGVYTNKGFVSSWAAPMDNWLPKYHCWVAQYGNQPKEATHLTWAQLKESWLPQYDIILSAGQKPEMVMGHQFTGDVCYMPGSYSKEGLELPLDVNVFSKAFIDAIWANTPIPTPQPRPIPRPLPGPDGAVDYVVTPARVNIRAYPSGDAAWVRYAVKDEVLKILKIVNGWASISDGTFVMADYIVLKPAGAPDPRPQPQPDPGGAVDYMVLNPRVNVRAQPSPSATWVRFAVKDEVLSVVNIANGWAQLADGNFVFADYLLKKPATGPTPQPQPQPQPQAALYAVLYTRINVRSGPSSDTAWVRYAVKDEVLQVVNIINGWAQLADGTYVLAEYIQKH